MLFILFYLAIFLVTAGLVLRLAAERLVTGFFIDTPISLVALFFLGGALAVSYLGLEAVARTARFLVGILIITAMAMIILTIPFWKTHSLFPLWGPGPWALIKGAVKNSGDFVHILLLGIIYPFLPRDRLKAIGIKSVFISGFFMFLYILVPLLIFSFPTVMELSMPSMEMARIINIGRFGQRLEVIFLPVWVFSNLITISIALYASAAVLTRVLKLSDYRPFVLSSTVFILVIAFLPQNVSQAIDYHHHYLSQYSLGMLVLILLILHSIAWIKGKGVGKE
jgi:spore germination protein (amino acid permease)